MDIGGPEWAPHPKALSVLYANLELHALGQGEAFTGTAGSVIERTNAGGVRFYAHQFYDPDRKQRERYVAGPVGDPIADAKAAALRERIADLKGVVPELRLLGREGFWLTAPRTYGIVASLHNHGVFGDDAVLVGAGAFGAIINRLGVRTPENDADDAGPERVALAFPSVPEKRLVDMVARLPVDLLLASRDHGLRYLIAESQPGLVMTRESCCMVRVPVPERLALHLISGASQPTRRRLRQAAVLCSATAELFPGAIADAVAALPKRAVKHFTAALPRVERLLAKRAPRAWEELRGVTPARRRPRGNVRAP